MSNNIKILDQETINHIAAGEVIDRPSSIVKELLENAIDAKATAVTVEIKDGGISFIRITDNGTGIDKDDIKIAFVRHSTSKIREAIDLMTVSSLGFRGEALSSIAAVAQVELITKIPSALTGTRYVIEGGVEKSIEDIGVPDGTTFLVRNLFFNTPARRKFLKSAQTETGYIYDLVSRIALSHPEVSIRFISNNQNKLYTAGNGNLKDVIYSVFGREYAANLIEINYKSELVNISGFIGKPTISRGSRSYENYFINGRYIKNGIIFKAIEESYKPFLMQHKFPFTALHFTIDSQYIDVNVHPSKMELRFNNAANLYPVICDRISLAITGRELIPEVKMDSDSIIEKAEIDKKQTIPEPFEAKRRIENTVVKNATIPDLKELVSPVISKTVIPDDVIIPESAPITKPISKVPPIIASISKTDEVSNFIKEETPEYQDKITMDSNNKATQLELFDNKLLSKAARLTHKLIGQVFDTYWIVEYDDKMFIIDQHAAHEKVLYERTLNSFKNAKPTSQYLNPPIILNLTINEANLLNKYINNFTDLGYEIELFGGNDFNVRAVPAHLPNIAEKELLMDLIDNLSEEDRGIHSDLITERIASMSCKAAVKGNNKLSISEANELIDELLHLDNPYNCPHGRPTIISMSKYELEKKFKRII